MTKSIGLGAVFCLGRRGASENLGLLPGHFGLVVPLSQQAKKKKKRITVLGKVIDLDFQKAIGLLFQ